MTDNLKDTANDIKDYFVLRLKVPIFFYYLLALALWNWDIVLLIIKSKYDIEGVIWFIKNNYNGSQRIWMPFLLALGSSIFFPAIMVILDWCLKFVSKERIKSAKHVAEAEAEAQYDVQVKRNKTSELKILGDDLERLKGQVDLNELLLKDYLFPINDSIEDDAKYFNSLINEINIIGDEVTSKEILNLLMTVFYKKYGESHSISLVKDYNTKNKRIYNVLTDENILIEEKNDNDDVVEIKITSKGIKFLYWLLGRN